MQKNGTADTQKLEVKRGVVDPQEVGLVVKVNDKEKLEVWNGDPCNTPVGTDSTIFPPFLKSEDGIIAYSTDLCLCVFFVSNSSRLLLKSCIKDGRSDGHIFFNYRSITAKFEKEVVFKGIPGNRYVADFGDMSSDPDKQCYCPAPGKCLKKGLIDITKCAGT